MKKNLLLVGFLFFLSSSDVLASEKKGEEKKGGASAFSRTNSANNGAAAQPIPAPVLQMIAILLAAAGNAPTAPVNGANNRPFGLVILPISPEDIPHSLDCPTPRGFQSRRCPNSFPPHKHFYEQN